MLRFWENTGQVEVMQRYDYTPLYPLLFTVGHQLRWPSPRWLPPDAEPYVPNAQNTGY